MSYTDIQVETLSRTQQVWSVCDELASEGSKPTMRLVKARGKMRGSDADIQGDANAWFSDVFAKITLAKQNDPVPDALKKAMNILWSVALEQATASFNDQKLALEHANDEAKTQTKAIQHELEETTRVLNETRAALSRCAIRIRISKINDRPISNKRFLLYRR